MRTHVSRFAGPDRSREVTGPPFAEMRLSPPENGENTIVLSGPHVPPRWLALPQRRRHNESVGVRGRDRFRSSRFNLRSAKNPIEALSGDQNGEMPPSVPGSCQASSTQGIEAKAPFPLRCVR